ncbi:type II CAAX prenyl endopeptidase Rce1 family protein [Geodermatophilus sp. DSM 44513]|uniref:CPBP family glutamic-type intramembrane protease n=1 Tax=Geodermatophilus sp. DSM 44513 TaxID=1528104 RepID=UPI0014127B05|nr:CPBP family glutamic-type intramembrane protease [Geodermatophilus sp. DSM 44513]WNV74528.1 type II CAAX endopeptidase family protein [Geodermatophilus sp. DSM 44513]
MGPLPGGPPAPSTADDEPYTGPPPTGRYAAPPHVPGAAHGVAAWPAAGAPGGTPPWQQALLRWQPGPQPPAWLPPGGSGLQPPPGTPPHDEPVEYLQVMRTRDWRWWRPVLGLLLFAVFYGVAAVLVVIAGLATGVFPDPTAIDPTDLTDPTLLLVTNVSLIVAVPCVWLAWAAPHGLRIGWSSSVLARLRWRLLAPCTLLTLPTLVAGLLLSVGLSVVAGDWAPTGPVRDYGWLLLVVLLTTPLQSAAEEYVFRGYLSQAIAAWVGRPRAGAVVAAVLTAALFSALHLPPDLWTFLDRFAFGLAASAVVWLTGGLEAAIVLHAVNNVVVFALAGGLGEGVATDAVPAGAGVLVVLVDLLAMGGYVALVARSRGRLHPQTRTAALDLRAPSPPGVPGPPPGIGYALYRRREAQHGPWGMG